MTLRILSRRFSVIPLIDQLRILTQIQITTGMATSEDVVGISRGSRSGRTNMRQHDNV